MDKYEFLNRLKWYVEDSDYEDITQEELNTLFERWQAETANNKSKGE